MPLEQEIGTELTWVSSGGGLPRSQSPCAPLQKRLVLMACRRGGTDSTSLGRPSVPIRARRFEFLTL